MKIKNLFMKFKDVFRFSLSSIVSFVIDYSLFTIFSLFISNISICNLLARIISATCNYLMNRNLVFKSNNDYQESIMSYALLAFIIIMLNTVLLNVFVYKFLFNKYIAKIIIEIVLFIFSFVVQKKIIFKK